MKTEVKKIDGTKREINVEVSGEIIKNKFDAVFEKIGKEAKVPGFRQGHVPRDILEKNFSSYAYELALKELLPDIYAQAIEKENLEVVELPHITDVKLDRNTLSFKATVEVAPDINLKGYKKIRVNYKNIEVTPEEVNRNIDALKEKRKVDSLDDYFARSLGYHNIQALQKAVETQIFINKDNQQRIRIEKEIIDSITDGVDFKIPQSLVNRQLEDLLRQSKIDLALKGVPKEKIDEQEDVMRKQLEPEAIRQVRVYLILTEIAKRENIPLDDNMTQRVMEFLLREADWQETN